MRTFYSFALAIGFLLPTAGCPGDDTGETSDTIAPTSGPTGGTNPTGGSGSAGTMDDGSGTDTNSTNTETGPSGGFCVHQCEADGDCTIGGMDVGLTCQGGFCAGEADGCTDDAGCVAELSGWTFGMPCTAGGGECDALMQICIDVDGSGFCVSGPSDFLSCADIMQDEIMTQDIDGNDVTVCGNSNAACGDDGFCFAPCAADADCAADFAPVCNTGTGFCECGTDEDCATLGFPDLSVCNAGVCGCSEDANCTDGGQGDVCNDGFCGCSGDAACEGVENSFDGGSISCVEL